MYPPSAGGSAPGVEITRARSGPTRSRTASRPEVRTGTPGNALPSSSAVRLAPTTTARTWKKPHSGQCQSPAMRPHQRQCGAAWDDGSDNGPWQAAHLAGVRQRPHAMPGT